MTKTEEKSIALPSWVQHAAPVESRDKGIGGTDMACILGMNPWGKTAVDVWAQKTGKPQPARETTPVQQWGNLLEPLVAQQYANAIKAPMFKNSLVYRSTQHKHMIGTPDYLHIAEPIGMDCKTAHWRTQDKWGEAGTDAVPEQYITQAQWYMALFGAEQWNIPVLIGGNDFRIYVVKRQVTLIEVMIERANEFWEKHVQTDMPPDPVDAEALASFLKYVHPRNLLPMREATEEELPKINLLIDTRELVKQAETDKSNLELEVKQIIGDHEGITYAGGKITWKNNKDGSKIDWEAVARELNAPKEVIAKYTTTTPGARVMRVTENKREIAKK